MSVTHPRCYYCGYDLHGLVPPIICPECGNSYCSLTSGIKVKLGTEKAILAVALCAFAYGNLAKLTSEVRCVLECIGCVAVISAYPIKLELRNANRYLLFLPFFLLSLSIVFFCYIPLAIYIGSPGLTYDQFITLRRVKVVGLHLLVIAGSVARLRSVSEHCSRDLTLLIIAGVAVAIASMGSYEVFPLSELVAFCLICSDLATPSIIMLDSSEGETHISRRPH